MHSNNRTTVNPTTMMINMNNSHSTKYRSSLQMNVIEKTEIIDSFIFYIK